ncbi:MAG: hypothetical protein H6833_00220 [Planctomycetes bacterium]|nr:hypothetical protein [Planctomycetota bacterium]
MSAGNWTGKLSPLRPFKSWLAKHPWIRRLLWLTPILIVLALLGPVLGAVDTIFGLVGKVVSPLFETAVGRVVLAILVSIAAAVVIYVFFKERVLDSLRRYALSVHLRALEARLTMRTAEAQRLLRRVTRIGRFLNLGKGLAASHGALDIAARLELARMYSEGGDPKRARRELAHVPRKELKGRLRLTLAELEARIHAASESGIAETVIRKLREAHEAWPAHPVISMSLATRLEASGDDDAAAHVLRETLRKATKFQSRQVTSALAELELRRSEKAIAIGEYALAQKLVDRALRLEESEAALLQRADLLLARADLDGALRILSDLGTPAAKARARQLLVAEDVPLDPARLLERIPSRTSLMTLAETYYERGELDRARRCLDVLLREMETPSPRALALLASIEMEEGSAEQAREVLGRALHARTRREAMGERRSPGNGIAREPLLENSIHEGPHKEFEEDEGSR